MLPQSRESHPQLHLTLNIHYQLKKYSVLKSIRRERIIQLHKEETWSADLIEKLSYVNIINFILTVTDMFTKQAWAVHLKIKSGISLTNGFELILSEVPPIGSDFRKTEKLRADRGSEFYDKTFKY